MPSQAVLELLVELKDQASKGLGGIAGSLGDIAKTAAGFATGELLVRGFDALSGALKGGIADAKETNLLMAQTQAVIKSTGGAAGVTAQQVADYATALSDASGKSLFGDDQIQQSENLLLTFTNIKDKTLEAATAISVDMAQALGGAPKDSAIQLGKALNDPIAGISALSRVGVTFTDEQKNQIKAMQDAGNMAGAQGVILAELNKEFGGSAEAAAKAAGGWNQFKARMGEVKESLGAAILPLFDTLGSFLNNTVAPAVEALAATFGNLVQAFQTGAADGGGFIGGLTNALYSLDTISPVFDTIADGILAITDAFQTGAADGDIIAGIANALYSLGGVSPLFDVLGDAIIVVADAIGNIIGAFQDAGPFSAEFGAALGQISPTLQILQGVIAAAVPIVQSLIDIFAGAATKASDSTTTIGDVWTAVHATIEQVVNAVLAVVNAVFGQIQIFLEANGDDISNFLADTWGQIKDIIILAAQLIQATIVPIFNAIATFINTHSTEIQTVLKGAWDIIKGAIKLALDLITGIFKVALALLKGDWSGAWDIIKETAQRVWDDIKGIVTGAIEVLKGAFGLVKDAVMTILKPGIDAAQGVIQPIVGWFNDISNAIAGVIGWIERMIDKLNSISIPDWLKGSSPPPMADWFSYIGKAVADVNTALAPLNTNLRIPAAGGMGAMALAGGGSTTNNVTLNVNVPTGANARQFTDTVLGEVDRRVKMRRS